MRDLARGVHRKADAQIAMTDDHWKLFFLQGVGLVLFGIAAPVLPNVTSLAVEALAGWLLLMGGLFRLASGFSTQIGPGHWSSFLLSALMVTCGAVLAFYPMARVVDLRMVLAAYLAVHAVAGICLAASLREETRWWIAIPAGSLVDLLLAALLLAEWPSTARWVFGLYLGLNLGNL